MDGGTEGPMEKVDDERERLTHAVDEFAAEMKARLLEKHEEGYRGWNEAYPSDAIAVEINRDSVALIKNHKNRKAAVDIANRAMMLWIR